MPITSCISYLSVYCRMCGLSHTLGKKFSKAELSVDIHHPLADNFTGCISSSQLSWHISPANFPAHLCIYSPTFLICFVYAHYYICLSIAGCVPWTLGKMFSISEISVDVHHLLADVIFGHINSPGISHLISQLISNGEHLFSDLSHLFCLCPLLSYICLRHS